MKADKQAEELALKERIGAENKELEAKLAELRSSGNQEAEDAIRAQMAIEKEKLM